MSNMYSSPGDPLFWLHHGKLDFEWNKWQQLGISPLLPMDLVYFLYC